MISHNNERALLDKDFLYLLDQQHNKAIYAKIISLNFFTEDPIEEITGVITNGSINIDGNSIVRRTCSLTMIAQEQNLHEYYWGMRTKFKLYIGVENNINSNYENIIWFKQGTYILTSFSATQNTNSYQISLSGKDKMCLLNGDVGGNITALSWDFGMIETIQPDGSIEKEKYLIKDIILESVHKFANEPYYNIIITDLDNLAVELMEYRGKKPMYIFLNEDGDAIQPTFDEKMQLISVRTNQIMTLEEISMNNMLDHRIQLNMDNIANAPEWFRFKTGSNTSGKFTVVRIEYGDTAGYRPTDLVYAGELIGKVGESVASAVLEKIKKMLGDFEYFYNLDGQFVFQRKRSYINMSWNNIVKREAEYVPISFSNTSEYIPSMYYYKELEHDNNYKIDLNTTATENRQYYKKVYNDDYVENSAYTSAVTYYFENGNLVTSFANTPNFSNLKNDYSIWGTRKSVTGKELPVHMRYAIDKKPVYYKSYNGTIFCVDTFEKDFRGQNDLVYMDAEQEKISIEDLDPTLQEYIKRREEFRQANKLPSCLQYAALIGKDALTSNSYIPNKFYYYKDGEFLLDNSRYYDENKIYYKKSANWWNVKDWAEYYKYLTGSTTYPSEKLRKYWTGYTILDIDTFFPSKNRKWGTAASPWYYRPLFLFDVFVAEGQDGIREFKNGGHNPICGTKNSFEQELQKTENTSCTAHSYIDFLPDTTKGSWEGYIFSPSLPENIQIDGIDNINDLFNRIEEGVERELETDTMIIINGSKVDITNANIVDWREIIYQMAYDFNRYGKEDNFLSVIGRYNQAFYPNGTTGYETYYTDILGFWRQLYDPYYENSYHICACRLTDYNNSPASYYWYEQCDENSVFSSTKHYYVIGAYGDYQMRGSLIKSEFDKNKSLYFTFENGSNGAAYKKDRQYYEQIADEFNAETHWSNLIYQAPEQLNFWFDFLDSDDEGVGKYSVSSIGDRPKAENDNNVKSIYFRENPTILFRLQDSSYELSDLKLSYPGYTVLSIPDYWANLFSISSQGKSALNKVEEFLYSYAHCAETINMSAIPVYYLEPNYRIFVRDDNSGIVGEYIINKLSYQLSHNGQMSISATKAIERIF